MNRPDLIQEYRQRIADGERFEGLANPRPCRITDINIASVTDTVVSEAAVQIAQKIVEAEDAFAQRLVPRYPQKIASHGMSRKEVG